MRIYICCSKHFYHLIAPIKGKLEERGHAVTLPNSYDEPFKEEEMKKQGKAAHVAWKAGMIRMQDPKVRANDAVLVLNFEKNGVKNYIGGATFLEIFMAFQLGKRIFLYNPVPDNIFRDELVAMDPVLIEGDLSRIR